MSVQLGKSMLSDTFGEEDFISANDIAGASQESTDDAIIVSKEPTHIFKDSDPDVELDFLQSSLSNGVHVDKDDYVVTVKDVTDGKDSDEDFVDLPSDDEINEDNVVDESPLERIIALKEMLSPTVRNRFSVVYSRTCRISSTVYYYSSNFLWVASSAFILGYIPLALVNSFDFM